MERNNSKILHDYRPHPTAEKKPASKVRWFVIGLGLPFLAIFVFTLISPADTESAVAVTPSSLVTKELPLPIPSTPDGSLDALGSAEPVLDAMATVDLAAEDNIEADHITLTVKRGDTLDGLFRSNGLNRSDLGNLMRVSGAKKHLRLLKPGDKIQITHDAGRIVSVTRRLNETASFFLTRQEDGFVSSQVDHPIERRLTHAHATITRSLFEAAKSVGVSDKMTMNLAGIFAWDVDFVLDIREGDEFIVVYEEIWQDGRYVRDGDIIAAEFVNSNKVHRALRFTKPNGDSDYYTPEGLSVRKAFIRAPVDFSRISSSFNLRRKHPILNRIRAHKGVDYAAPSGTPINAAGDGKVIFRGKKGSYGNAVIIQHGSNITTLYGHMQRFARGARSGSRVEQGQVIGYVGQTGLASGPHLHYEYRVNGVHRNPRTVKLPQADPIASEYLDDFLSASGPLLSRLDVVRRTQLAASAD